MKTSGLCLALCIHAGICIGAVAAVEPVRPQAEMQADDKAPAPLKRKQLYQAARGPWGEIEYYVTNLAAPDWMLESSTMPPEQAEWHFPGQDLSRCRELLLSAGFKEADLGWFDDPRRKLHVEGDSTLYPPHEFIEQLAPELRAALADLLRTWPENDWYCNPVVVIGSSPAEWMTANGVSAEVSTLAEKLCYKRGRHTLFNDASVLMSRVKSPDEGLAVLKMLTKQHTLVARLRIGGDTDVQQVRDYWSAGYKHKDLVPLLLAVTDNEEVEVMDLVHLLPPLPRKLLYTYPSLQDGLIGEFPDCLWTSFNFFNYQPSQRFMKVANMPAVIESRYQEVSAPLRYGDIIMLWDPATGSVIHSAVYLAADLVFTKNGMSPLRPWVLMRFDDMTSVYCHRGELNLQFFRLK